ncbi:MAG: hypothetical protein M3011_10810 [Actinomycetota bacterium]|nr:hypothetical protein [Actinomycetota bacterium]
MSTLTRWIRAPKMEALFAAVLILFGFRLGVRSIGDNSMFTHLRTGVDIAGGRGIPRIDPYSFTAAGKTWTVQSWLPEWTYGWAHSLGGYRLVVLEQAVLCAGLAWLIVRLARAGSPLRTTVAALVAIGIGAPYWSPRPLLFGLIFMALLITVVERRRSPWLLVPIVYLWVQCHGSFPLGLAWVGARAFGQWLDWRDWPDDTMKYIGAFVAGLVVSVVNPLGARLLLFPFTILGKQATFSSIVEWQSPDFHGAAGRVALVFLACALVILARSKVSWRDLIPVVGFLLLSLLATRNLPVLAVVLAPVLGRALRRTEGSNRSRSAPVELTPGRRRINRTVMAVIIVAFALFGASIWTTPPIDAAGYPEKAATYLDAQGLLAAPHVLAEQDFVGNYLTLRFGRRVPVFVDDRYDMYPTEVATDYRTLRNGGPSALSLLDKYGIDVVLWDRKTPLATILASSEAWTQVFRDGDWVVYRRTSSMGK